MPMNYKLYPQNWTSEIVPSIHRRAGGQENENGKLVGAQCEWHDWEAGEWVRCPLTHWEPRRSGKKVICTTAHIGAPRPGDPDYPHGNPHKKMDCRDENLLLMCEKHHLTYDHADNVKNASRTRAIKVHKEKSSHYDCDLFGGQL